MQQTILLLIAAGGLVFGFLAIVDTLLAFRARRRAATGAERPASAAQPLVYSDRSDSARRSGRKLEQLDPVRIQHLIVELHRTRSILLGWLSVLEAFALGDAWRATALRAELGDLNTCDITLVGDANVIATYQMTVEMLRNQAGRGLPPEVASEMASIRVRLLTALAEQERRLNHGERPVIAEPLAHLDLWGPPRPITEVTIRPPSATSQPLLSDSSTSSPGPSYIPAPEPPLIVRPVSVGLPALSDPPREMTPSSSTPLLNASSPSPVPTPVEPVPAASEPPIARRATPRPSAGRPKAQPSAQPQGQPTAQPTAHKAPVRRSAPRAAAADAPPPSAQAKPRPATTPISTAATKPATRVEAVAAKPARGTRAVPTPTPTPKPTPTLAPHLVPSAVPTPRAARTMAKPAPLAGPSTVPVAVSRPTGVPAGRPAPIGANKPIAPGPRPAARATLGPMSQSASSPGGKAPARPTSKRSAP